MNCANHQKNIPEAVLGLAALSAQWFKEVGLHGNDVVTALQADYAAMVRFLSGIFGKVVAPGVISTGQEADGAVELFRRERIDALLLIHIMWSEDAPLIALLEGMGDTPLLLWNYHPTGSLAPYLTINDLFRHSGTVGMLQGSAVLQRRKASFEWISGAPADEALQRELKEYAAALAIRKRFRGMPAGRIAGRCEAMSGTFVDAQTLRTRLGVQLVEMTAENFAAACSQVPGADIGKYLNALKERFEIAGVSAESLRLACRNTLALDGLVAEHNLGALAIQDLDPTLHRLAGTRPCLCPPRCAERGIPVAMESDINSGLGMLAAMTAAGAPGMFTEIFTFDARENLLLMGHAGVHDPAAAGPGAVRIVPDAEYRHADVVEGAWFEFIMAAGPVTCVSFYDTGGGYRMVVCAGESQGGRLRLEGYAHVLVRPMASVPALLSRLVRRGLTQHFAVVPGHVTGILAKWAHLTGIEFVEEGRNAEAH